MNETLAISVEEGPDGVVTARVSGEIDLGNVERLRQAIDSDTSTPERLRVDLSDVTYIDSAGIAVLFARASKGNLVVHCRDDSVVAPLIEITRLGEVASVTKEQ